MSYTAMELAEYIVNKCMIDGCPISNLYLQKILYYIQRDFLQKGKIAFHDDIEAWQIGPVIPNVYYEFCGFGAMPITASYNQEINPEDKDQIDSPIEEKRDLEPWDMTVDIHKVSGAWAKTYQHGLGNRNVISIGLITNEKPTNRRH